jgi:hypothetical protein
MWKSSSGRAWEQEAACTSTAAIAGVRAVMAYVKMKT